MSKQDIVSLVTVSGEYIGKFIDESSDKVTLGDPHLVTPNGESVSFLPAVCLTGKHEPSSVSFNKSCVVLVTETQEEVAKQYRQAVSGLIL